MKLCITAKGNSLDAAIDPSFGRCQYFIFVDADTLQFEAVENPNTRASGGAGTNSGQLIANKGTDVLLTGDVGPNAARVLAAAGVNVVTGTTGTVREAVLAWKKGASQMPHGDGTGPLRGGGPGTGRGMGGGMHQGARTHRTSSTLPSVERVAGALGTLVVSALRARGSATVSQSQQTQPKAVAAPVEKAVVDQARCSGCGICVRSCTAGAIQMNGVARIDADKCTGCGDCVAACPRGAISLRQLPSGR